MAEKNTPSHEEGTPMLDPKYRIDIALNGPYLVWGKAPIRQEFMIPDHDGNSWTFRAALKEYQSDKDPVALCRCGASRNKPYCDGAHMHTDWDPTLTAPRSRVLEGAETINGPGLDITDNEKFCAFARFCDAKGGIWNLIERSDDPLARQYTIYEANHCPAGRLKAWNTTTGRPYELKLEPGIGILEDPALHISGGLWVKGGIPVRTADGYTYEVRNRVTLCRCGQSSNKPFCDGTHASMKFSDGMPYIMDGEEL